MCGVMWEMNPGFSSEGEARDVTEYHMTPVDQQIAQGFRHGIAATRYTDLKIAADQGDDCIAASYSRIHLNARPAAPRREAFASS
jgi:hypothetical protein